MKIYRHRIQKTVEKNVIKGVSTVTPIISEYPARPYDNGHSIVQISEIGVEEKFDVLLTATCECGDTFSGYWSDAPVILEFEKHQKGIRMNNG